MQTLLKGGSASWLAGGLACLVPRFTDKNLYSAGGPRLNDIKQDAIGDCYFVATLAAVASQNPRAIRDAIAYNSRSNTFCVRLYELSGKARWIVVTQAEIEDNVTRHGGSYVDNTSKCERVWPAVMETAYAKMFDSDAKNGLGEGYRKITSGGWPADAMMALTGSVGSEVRYVYVHQLAKTGSVALLGSRIATALIQKRAVTLGAVPEVDSRGWLAKLIGLPIPQDGLADRHVYSVVSMTQSNGDWLVKLRNPWGTNMGVGEGRDSESESITVSLMTLVDTGGLKLFQVSRK